MNKILWFFLLPLFSFLPFEVTNTTAQTLPFTQNWANAALITSDNWSQVPGIEGFTGSDLPVPAGTNPQILTSPGFFPTTAVIANQADPNNLTTGGVAEFDGIPNPSIALQPNNSNNAYAPYLVISLNTTNRQNINVAYNLRDIDGSTDNAVQPVALLYRIGSSGDYINVPAAFVADATSGPSLATMVTAVNAVLPAAADNKPLVQLRIITADAVGNDEWVAVDDIAVSGTAINPVPVVNTTPGTTTYIYNTPVVIDNGITVSDANNSTLASATISIATGYQPATDLLLFTADPGTMGNINGSYSSGTLTLFSAPNSATLAQWQTALRSIRFSAAGVPANHSVTINFTINDGTSNSLIASRPVAVFPSPPPVIVTTGSNTTYIHPTAIAIDNTITVTDANSATLASATVSFTGTFQFGADILSFTNDGSTMGNITGNFLPPPGQLFLTSAGATATLAQWQAAFRAVRYNCSTTPQIYNRTISFVANDGANNSVAATKTIAIQPGPSPSVTTTAGNTTYIHSAPVKIDNGISVADSDNPTLSSASISFTGSFEQSNDFLVYSNDGATMGNITGNYSGPTGILNLSSAGATATLAQWQAALRAVTYFGTGNMPPTYNRTISFTVNDGQTNSNGATKTISYMPLSSIGQSWSPAVQVFDPNTGNYGDAGRFTKMLIVNGNPALVYYDQTRTNLVYRRATDAMGTNFGPAITIDSIGNVGLFPSVQIVNGSPAISYYDQTNFGLKYVRALDSNGSSWGTPVKADVVGNVGQSTSLLVVNGNPAIAYYNGTNRDLKYVRATDISGTNWGTPLSIDITGEVGDHASMQVVNGNPAITYWDGTNQDLKYVRATDISGTSWGTPLVIDGTNSVGLRPSLQVISGNPAVSYYDLTNTALKYIRSTDASGNAWNAAPMILTFTANVGSYSSLQVVNGNPAISFYDVTNKDLKYIRSLNPIGSLWDVAITVDAAGSVGGYNSLHIVNGNPAISCFDETNGNAKFVRASDNSGTTWGTPLSVDVMGEAGGYISLQMVGGYPAFAYYDFTTDDLLFVRALNAQGTAWGSPVAVDTTGIVGSYLSMQIVNGFPAISYRDESISRLKYVRATDALGTGWGAPVNAVSGGSSGFTSCLAVVNGYPAISYYEGQTQSLRYVRASDANGTAWNAPVLIGQYGDAGAYGSLKVVNGNPAVSFNDENLNLKYVRAIDASGTSWENPVVLDPSGTVNYATSLQIVNGVPAISYYDATNKDLKYIRATDASGTTWNSPQVIDAPGDMGYYSALEVINNKPVIAYVDAIKGDLRYVSASDNFGGSWSTPVVPDSLEFTGGFPSVIVKGNNIMIAYYNYGQTLPYFLPGHDGFISASNHYFRSKQNGNWNNTLSWESSPDNIHWGPATLTPNYTANTITIKNGHTINVTANITVDQLVLEPGSVLVTTTGNHLIVQ